MPPGVRPRRVYEPFEAVSAAVLILTPSSTTTIAPASAVPAWFLTVPLIVAVVAAGVGVGVVDVVGDVGELLLSPQPMATAASAAAITRRRLMVYLPSEEYVMTRQPGGS